MTTGGIVAVGDSIINADKSWGYWIAQATGMELERFSVGGATSTQALAQLDAVTGRYRLGVVTVGTNDAMFSWNPERFDANLERIITHLVDCCERVIVQTIPLGLSRFPGSGSKIERCVVRANQIIADVAGRHGAAIVDGSDLRGYRLMSVDRVHPSLLGQIVLADRAAAALALPVMPSSLHDGSQPFNKSSHIRETLVRGVRAVVKRVLRYEATLAE